jgi:hypothetical protein
MQLLPDPGPLPLVQAPPTGHARAESELARQVLPGDPSVQHEQDPLQRLPIRQPFAARIAKAPLPSSAATARPAPTTGGNPSGRRRPDRNAAARRRRRSPRRLARRPPPPHHRAPRHACRRQHRPHRSCRAKSSSTTIGCNRPEADCPSARTSHLETTSKSRVQTRRPQRADTTPSRAVPRCPANGAAEKRVAQFAACAVAGEGGPGVPGPPSSLSLLFS